MAASHLTSSIFPASITPDRVGAEAEVELRLGVHDASRVEWIVSLPLPRKTPVPFSVEVTIDITSNLFAKHAP